MFTQIPSIQRSVLASMTRILDIVLQLAVELVTNATEVNTTWHVVQFLTVPKKKLAGSQFRPSLSTSNKLHTNSSLLRRLNICNMLFVSPSRYYQSFHSQDISQQSRCSKCSWWLMNNRIVAPCKCSKHLLLYHSADNFKWWSRKKKLICCLIHNGQSVCLSSCLVIVSLTDCYQGNRFQFFSPSSRQQTDLSTQMQFSHTESVKSVGRFPGSVPCNSAALASRRMSIRPYFFKSNLD